MLEEALHINPNLKIGLAAPTGKATRRLQESLQTGIASTTPSHRKILNRVPCNTLHRWLQPKEYGFRKNRKNPLNLDLLVVDEMSMVDLNLMKALLEALPINAQLILVGDYNQLPPIGSGSIWHEIQSDDNRIKFGRGSIHLHQHILIKLKFACCF